MTDGTNPRRGRQEGDDDPNPMKLTRFHKQFNLNDAIVRLAEALEIPEQELRDEFNKQKGLR